MIRARWRLAAACAAAALTTSCSMHVTGIGPQPRDHAPSSDLPSAQAMPSPPPEKPRLREAPTETHQGKGNGTVTLTWPTDVAGFLTFDRPKCNSNVAVHTDGAEGLPINAIGKYHGTTWFNVSPGDERAHKLDIEANAAWTATIADYRSVPTVETGKPYSAHGDAVVKIPAGATLAKISSKTPGNTIIWTLTDGELDLAVNEIGNYEGELPVAGTTYVHVNAYESNWTLTVS